MEKGRLVLLIVDHNSYFVKRMICLLKRVENIAYMNVVSSYEEADAFLKSDRPDVILIDISLPDKNGIELLHTLNELERKCHVIVITNCNDDCCRHKCLAMGASYFLNKSIDLKRIPSIISQLVPI